MCKAQYQQFGMHYIHIYHDLGKKIKHVRILTESMKSSASSKRRSITSGFSLPCGSTCRIKDYDSKYNHIYEREREKFKETCPTKSCIFLFPRTWFVASVPWLELPPGVVAPDAVASGCDPVRLSDFWPAGPGILGDCCC